ncbi:MAG: C45 family peptidase [Planctomycetaceae bacterium]
MIRNCRFVLVLAACCALSNPVIADSVPASAVSLTDGLRPFAKLVSGTQTTFTLTGELQIKINGQPQPVQLKLARIDDESFDLALTHAEYAVEIRRRADSTAMILPLHHVAIVGHGAVDDSVRLSPKDLTARLISPQSEAIAGLTIVSAIQPEFLDPLIELGRKTLKAQRDPASNQWVLTEASPIRFPAPGELIVTGDFGTAHLTLSDTADAAEAVPANLETVEIPRTELERTLLRGVHRATEILAPSAILKNPPQQGRRVPHGELRWIDGQRVAILDGTPEQIGTAHGQLLKPEAMRCIESVLYTFGTAHAIRTGHWFRHDIEDAYARLSPHIPERHKQETRALAAALELPPETLEILNVFPEMFHCSGFAVFGSATKDGTLYHGRVLDYMTTIGLQDAATTFIVNPEGHIPFANVGYAAFIGSVSGMNARAISLGEMGGRGEGNWDGVPMATLMRRALEECSTLDQVMQLWTVSPRTCEYYYVFADGKTNRAVGVAALPESIEFIQPGQRHERLGDGIPDSVVLSAGSRLETLRSRVIEKHGQIDAEIGQWLMSRPVAMQSNLHNVLFVPQKGILYVANASHSKPAAEQPYSKLDLTSLLQSTGVIRQQAAVAP